MIFMFITLTGSVIKPTDRYEKYRAQTRNLEFDYTTWTLQSIATKFTQSAANWSRYFSENDAKKVVLTYLKIVEQSERLQNEINQIYSDPAITDPGVRAEPLLRELDDLQRQRDEYGELAESVIQQQVSEILASQGLSFLGQPLPPTLYHVSELPLSLIISPREVIKQDASISLVPELNLDQIVGLEKAVAEKHQVSTMVTRIGGVGVYPTMVGQSTNLPWLIEVVAHEWIHNYLTLKPLGIRYDYSPELRTMNETTANLAGKEISRLVLEKYYPEYLPPPTPPEADKPKEKTDAQPAEPEAFNFNKEMHITRVEADRLLKEGMVDEAEAYMESRRQFMWDHGYQLRVLNQAYFAFYGAYADTPGGAAGEDPVGPAVRALRDKSTSLFDFIKQISRMTSFTDLQEAVEMSTLQS